MYHPRKIVREGANTFCKKGVDFSANKQDYGEVVEEKQENNCQANCPCITAQEVCYIEWEECEINL